MTFDYRYERKFIINNSEYNFLKNLESLLPLNFSQKFPPRQVNSIYFDTDKYQLYIDTLNGCLKRFKVRIRCYGSLNKFYKPILEIKSKDGEVGKKLQFELNDLEIFNSKFSLSKITKVNNLSSSLSNALKLIKPKIVISYERKYLLSDCERFRFTIDSNIKFKKISNNNFSNIEKGVFYNYLLRILELKYSRDQEVEACYLTRKLPMRLSSCSKYTIALQNLGLVPNY